MISYLLALTCYWRHGSHWDCIGHFTDNRALYHCWACRKFRIYKER